MTETATKQARAPRPTTNELMRLCGRCGHQNGGHTLGRRCTSWGQGAWAALFDDKYVMASGGCSVTGCPCSERTDGEYTPTDEYPAQLAAAHADITATPARPSSRLYGPCMQGPGPCGKEPTRPYVHGACCEHCAPQPDQSGRRSP